jgi:hypothetical protein
MPLPLPPPDLVELGEYLATHIQLEIEAGLYSPDDLRDSPEISCLEQVAAEAQRGIHGKVPPAISKILARAKAAGRV